MVTEFFEAFGDPRSLANAGRELEDALRPLGFATQRSSQLRALSEYLVNAGDTVPSLDWSMLPGIGAYSSGMVAGALGARGAVAVDTNIARVMQRLYGVQPSHSEARKSTNIWSLTSRLTAESRSSIRILWALLDLAAVVCKTITPRCLVCPLRSQCTYYLRRGDPPARSANNSGRRRATSS